MAFNVNYYHNTLFVSKEHGNNVTAQRNNPFKPYADPWAAVADAVSGDRIIVLDGVWEVSPYSGSADKLLTDLSPAGGHNTEASLWKDGVIWNWDNSSGIIIKNHDPTPNVNGDIWILNTDAAESMRWDGGFVENYNIYYDGNFIGLTNAGASLIFNPHRLNLGTISFIMEDTFDFITINAQIVRGQFLIAPANVVANVDFFLPESYDYTTLDLNYTYATIISRDNGVIIVKKVKDTGTTVSFGVYENSVIHVYKVDTSELTLYLRAGKTNGRIDVDNLSVTDLFIDGSVPNGSPQGGLININGHTVNAVNIVDSSSPAFILSGSLYSDDTNSIDASHAISVQFAGFYANKPLGSNITALGTFTNFTT
ncbi:MAG: hypothetical protein KDH96_03495 [Candidatus Riesia sp.]|nr:hypothetical protein [Candidatus Riesia sp.]